MDRKITGRLMRLLLVLAVAGGGGWLIWKALPLVYPFLLGWLLAYLLNPLVRWLQRKARFPRWLAVTVVLLLFAVAMLTLITTLVMRLAEEVMNVSGSLERLVAWVEQSYDDIIARPDIQSLIDRINHFYNENPNYQETINNRISDTASLVTEAGTNLISMFLMGIVGFLSSLPTVAIIAVVVLLASFFIGKDWHDYVQRGKEWFPPLLLGKIALVWKDLRHALFGYIRAQFIMISITTVVVIVGLLVIGVHSAITIGLFIGFVDLLPYLGVGAVMIPWLSYAFLSADWQLGTGLSILYGIVLVARQFIEPKVLASSVGLEALPTLIAMFVGLQLFGIFGLIIGPVSFVVIAACRRAGVFRDIAAYIRFGAR
ncbi:sporulation integral membrane protein YtvI [Cohnella sp. GCM10027633]|uniref:sporulation integral membrane protein YtvI n=1 Tax=unclassified Cohnella TaxID=2636738 RepID=UPI00363FE7F7